jgi:hypothetical protein
MIRCRVAACREALGDRYEWSFYLINDSAAALDSVTLVEIGHRTIDEEFSVTMNVRVADLSPGAFALIWRGDSNGFELIRLSLDIRIGEREARLHVEFPILNIQRNFLLVDNLGKIGWQVAAQS